MTPILPPSEARIHQTQITAYEAEINALLGRIEGAHEGSLEWVALRSRLDGLQNAIHLLRNGYPASPILTEREAGIVACRYDAVSMRTRSVDLSIEALHEWSRSQPGLTDVTFHPDDYRAGYCTPHPACEGESSVLMYQKAGKVVVARCVAD